MAKREGDTRNSTKRAYIASKKSGKVGVFQVKLQSADGKYEPNYFTAFEGRLQSINMVVTESTEYGPSVMYIFFMEECELGELEIYIPAHSNRCCRLMNELLCLDTNKDCELKIYAYEKSNFIGLSIGSIGQTGINLKYPKLDSKKDEDKGKYVGVPNAVRTAKTKNGKPCTDVKGNLEYEEDIDDRVMFFLKDLCVSYPKMFDGEMFSPSILKTDPNSPYALKITETNVFLTDQHFGDKNDSTETGKYLERNKTALVSKIKDMIKTCLMENVNFSTCAAPVQKQYMALYNMGKNENQRQEITVFYRTYFMQLLTEEKPEFAFHEKSFKFENGLFNFKQPEFYNPEQSNEDLPF
jgi:hypothetical protein